MPAGAATRGTAMGTVTHSAIRCRRTGKPSLSPRQDGWSTYAQQLCARRFAARAGLRQSGEPYDAQPRVPEPWRPWCHPVEPPDRDRPQHSRAPCPTWPLRCDIRCCRCWISKAAPRGRAAAQPGCRAGPGGNRRRCGYRTWRPRCRSARSPHRTSCRRRPGAPRLRGRAALPGHGRRPPRQDHQRARYSTVLPAECAGREGSAAPPGGGGGNRPGIDV